MQSRVRNNRRAHDKCVYMRHRWGELSAEDVEPSVAVSNRLGWFSAFPFLSSIDHGEVGSLRY